MKWIFKIYKVFLRQKRHFRVKDVSSKLIFIGILITIASFCQSGSIKWSEIDSLKNNINYIRGKKYSQLIKRIKQKNVKLNYAEYFMIGKAYFFLNKYRQASQWFAKSIFYGENKSKKYTSSQLYSYLTSWNNILKKDSPLRAEALYHIALCHHKLGKNKKAIRFLEIMKAHLNEEIEEKYWILKAQAYMPTSKSRALSIYEKLIQKYKKSTYHVRKASIYASKKENLKALNSYFQALKFTNVVWSYKIAVNKIIKLIKKQPSLKNTLTLQQNIFLAEGYRITRQYSQAKKIWKRIKITSLLASDKFIYIKFYSLYLFAKKRYKESIIFINKYSQSLRKKEKEDILYTLSTKLLKINRYKDILALVPPYYSNQKLSLQRMQALRKLKSNTREQEAAYYLKNHDADSPITERTYFSSCLDKILKKETNQALVCLKSLATHTKGVSTGGRSRYFLAKLSEEKDKASDSRKKYAKVYLNSPSDFYTFKALEKSYDNKKKISLPKNNVNKIRYWLSYQAGNKIKLQKFFTKKKNNPKYSVDPFWITWEKDLDDLNNASPKIKQAIIFIAMGFNRLAQTYLKDVKLIDKLLIYQKAGHLIDDAYLKYTNLKAYLIKKKQNIDVFTLSNKAQKSLYPMPYLKDIKKASKRFNVKKASLYALMKQESAFHPKLRSSVGATGLMQIMPSTAKWLNKKLKIKNIDLTNPRHSILLGTKFYADVSKKNNNHFEEIAIAYNAGPGRLAQWKKKIINDDYDLFLEQIPFRETNLYVKKTKSYYDRYKILIHFFN